MVATLYPYLLIIHLICAIIFVGYIFCDIVLLNLIRKKLGDAFADKAFSAFGKRGNIMPFCFVLLLLTGGAMVSQHINTELGFFTTHLQQFLVIKAVLALILALLVATSMVTYYIFNKPNILHKIIHHIAFVFGFLIVILAKLAFY